MNMKRYFEAADAAEFPAPAAGVTAGARIARQLIIAFHNIR
jgi:hypothetical protein